MELGMLYEFEAPKPWSEPHPWGQRTIERQRYHDAVQQIAEQEQVQRLRKNRSRHIVTGLLQQGRSDLDGLQQGSHLFDRALGLQQALQGR